MKCKKLTDNPFLNLYQLDASMKDGTPFAYYFASRNKEEELPMLTGKIPANGIVIYPIMKEAPDHIVLIRQYRYPLNAYIYELPAGLVDEGETAPQAAVREMKEETGLHFIPLLPEERLFSQPSFLGAGITDETSTMVFGYADGSLTDAFQENAERIQVVLADKHEVLRILRQEKVSLRAQLLLLQFLQSQKEDPFRFLSLDNLFN